MAYQDYLKAQKSAEKQYRQAISRGEYPYLPVLEDLLRGGGEAGRIPMGQLEIPISLIAGTASAERTTAFASNFMPLLAHSTEFANKWSELYDSVKDKGVRDPITVFEYMHRFYVVEGNKRVSVSKFNGAVHIDASVTRILPKPSEETEYKIYAEFLEFYRVTGIYEILMSQEGSYKRLLNAIKADEGTEKAPLWSEDLRKDVKFLYFSFEAYYTEKNLQRLPFTTGDAFLHFLEIYGFDPMRSLSSSEIHRHMDRVFVEFRVLADENPTLRILDPTDVSKKVALTKKLPLSNSVLKIAFLYPKDPQNSSWAYNHEIGRRYIADAFGSAIETKAYIASNDEAEETISNAIADGNKVIFTTSPAYHAVSMRMAVAHPETIIMNCSVNTAYKQLRTYYLRIYEAKFITGIIAGSMTENERVGYIADYPILGTPASINAFALGVKLVNPRAKVYLDWSTLTDHDPCEYFREKHIDLISDRDINAPLSDDNGFGLYGLYDGISFRIAAPVWNWGSLYADMVHSILIGAWKNDGNQNETQALNYFWGMSSGAIDVACSDRLPSGTRKLVKMVQEKITKGEFNPFTGVIRAQDGTYIAENDVVLDPNQILQADWLLDNVIGRIPQASELEEQYRDFVLQHGLTPPTLTV